MRSRSCRGQDATGFGPIRGRRRDAGGKSMRLYHVSAEDACKAIQEEGIRPPSDTGDDRWRELTLPSRPGLVYLTDTHTFLHMLALSRQGQRPILVETEPDRRRLLPDKDWLGQVQDLAGGGSAKALAKGADPWAERSKWRDSLREHGTVAHEGAVPPERITRIVSFGNRAWQQAEGLCQLLAAETTKYSGQVEVVANMGDHLRTVTKWLAGRIDRQEFLWLPTNGRAVRSRNACGEWVIRAL